MNSATLREYGQMADRQVRQEAVMELDPSRGFMGLSDPAAAGLRCFRRYHKDARLEFRDGGGVLRWMTAKQARVHAILMRHSMTASGMIRQGDIAKEANCHISTVSRAVLKFQAWSMFGAIVIRGRNGGMFVFARAAGDRLQRFAHAAQARLEAIAVKVARRERQRRIDAPHSSWKGLQLDSYGLPLSRSLSMDATFRSRNPFRVTGDPGRGLLAGPIGYEWKLV